MDGSAAGASSDSGSNAGDLAYDTFYGAAIGGAAIACFFLAVDVLAGRPLHTPSMLGQVLFAGADPNAVTEVRLEMMAYFTVVHLVTFLALGWVISLVLVFTGISRGNVPVVAGLVFIVVSATFFAGDLLLMEGVAEAIGIPMILAANFVTALAWAAFLKIAYG
ncbi:MAG: hypothetical protein R3304_12325 [Longimicrobiales bacterium]|nr:hypothetical protein [Longimicrobiales bacterium]